MKISVTQSVKNEMLRYVQEHLGGDLTLKSLSRHSGYSRFHLHRILKEELNEPLGVYIKRKRIETAAFLIALTRLQISEIADWVGYSNDAAFSRAFYQVMLTSPRSFRKKGIFSSDLNELPKNYVSFEYRVVRLNPWHGLSFPGMFNYFDRSLFQCWKPAKEFLEKTNILSEKLQYWGVLYECPNVTGNLNSRIDAVVTLPNIIEPNLFNARYPGGKFAVFRMCAPHELISTITKNISAYILHETTMHMREGYSYVHYLQNPIIHEPDYLTTEWYVPIK